MSRLFSQSVRTNAYLIRGGGLRQSSSSTLGKGRYPVVWNHVGANPFMNHNTVLRGVQLYHANSNKNNHVLLASLQNEEPKAAKGLLEWIWKQVKGGSKQTNGKEDASSKKKEDIFANFDKHKKGGSGGGPGSSGGDDQQHVGAIAALLLLVLTGRAFLEEDSNINGRERFTIEYNRNRSSSATAGITSSRNMSKRSGTPGEKDWEDDTVMYMGSSQDTDDTSSTTIGGLMTLTQRGSVVDGS